MQECPGLRELKLAENNFNLWTCGHWTEKGLQSLQEQMIELSIKLVGI